MPKLRVGDLYDPHQIAAPEEAQLRLLREGAELLLLFNEPTEEEVRAVRRAPAEFAWVDLHHHGVLAYRLAPIPWNGVAYTPHCQVNGTPEMPGEVGTDRPVHIVLVDSSTGMIHAVRSVTWPPVFAGVVRASLQRMLAAPFDLTAATHELSDFTARYPSDRLHILTDVHCTGGQPT